jgi:hypothetical protein
VATIIEQAHTALRKATGLADYRLVEYGKGAGALLATVRELLQANPPSGYLFADPKDAATSVCLPAFIERVDTVIRAVS